MKSFHVISPPYFHNEIPRKLSRYLQFFTQNFRQNYQVDPPLWVSFHVGKHGFCELENDTLSRRKKAKRNILRVKFYWCLSVIFFTFTTIHSFFFYKSDISFDDQQLKFQHQDNAPFQDEGAGVKFDG